MLEHATSAANVSAFCQAVLAHLVPLGFWGAGPNAKENKRAIDQNIDTFVQLQRFANFSLHQVSQGLKVRLSLFAEIYAYEKVDFRYGLVGA